MSNEELVAAIQSGESERMGELWEQVEKFIAWKARRIMTTIEESSTIEVDDLIQSGYFALVAAVRSYKTDDGPFLKWLSYYLKTAFAEAAGYRTTKMQNDPMRYALSIDYPMGEDNDNAFGDLVPDLNAGEAMDAIEDDLWNKQLHAALDTALDAIPPQYGDVVRMRFYEGKTLGEISQEKNVSKVRVRQLENNGIKLLRGSEHACNLYPFYEFDFYCGTGLQTFRNRGLSVQEQYLVIMEDRRRRGEKKRRENQERILAEILSRHNIGV